MKKQTKINLLLLTVTLVFVGIMSACEGPQGPAGADGKDGKDGKDGQPGTASCKMCHDASVAMDSKKIQWANSLHATGTNFERNMTNCAPCHTQQGFREVVETGNPETSETIKDPVGITCKTCHFIHKNYDSTDFAIVKTDAIKLYHTKDGSSGEVDMKRSNLCGQCHQSRAVNPFPQLGGGDISITSPYWGPHHSPVANVLAGNGAYEIKGEQTYFNSPHTNITSCVTCHMGETYGAKSGGHSMNMKYEYHGGIEANISSCTDCHAKNAFPVVNGHTTFDYHGVQTKILEDLHIIRKELAKRGWLDTTQSQGQIWNDRPIASSNNPLVLAADDAGCLYNYLLIATDRSWGVHNSYYSKAVLANVKQHLGL